MARTRKSRYGIAEWYGRDFTKLSPEERKDYGALALSQKQSKLQNAPPCPFLSHLLPLARCNKSGGVCSIRQYDESGSIDTNGHVVTVCPSRFLQPVDQDIRPFQWISKKMLDLDDPIIVKETPFLKKIAKTSIDPAIQEDMEKEAEEEKKAGRIDWIIIDPKTLDDELKWCAIETQAVYFSGDSMHLEFKEYAEKLLPATFPFGKRRPDYRSNGPKRLAPQLDVKVPVIRNWFSKVVVFIDRYFFEQMNELEDAFPKAKNDSERRDNAEIVWFVVDYSATLTLQSYKVIYTDLESSIKALNATEPFSKTDFLNTLKSVAKDPIRANKVFKAS